MNTIHTLIIFLFVTLAYSSVLNAQKKFNKGVAYVHAQSGVPLRKAPDVKGERLIMISTGEKIYIKEEIFGTLEVEGSKGFWRAAEYEGRKGYVFDGFLSDLPVLSRAEGLLDWESEFIELTQHIELSGTDCPDTKMIDTICYLRTAYWSNGIIGTYIGKYQDLYKRGNIDFKIPNKRLEEVFIWFRSFVETCRYFSLNTPSGSIKLLLDEPFVYEFESKFDASKTLFFIKTTKTLDGLNKETWTFSYDSDDNVLVKIIYF